MTIVSETGGETLIKDDNLELKVYVRKKFHKGGASPIVSLVEIQSDLPTEGPIDNMPYSSSYGNPSYSSNDLHDLSFLDINLPISVRKNIPNLNVPAAKRKGSRKIAILMVYVDDIKAISDIKRKLEAEFNIKDLEKLKYFLGMKFARYKEGIFLNQHKYILDLLTETGMPRCKVVETQMDPNVKLTSVVEYEIIDREHYQRLAERLIYLSHTRLDIAFVVSVIRQFMHAPGAAHFEAIFIILIYFKGTSRKGLILKNRGHIPIEAYTNADWASNINDKRSTLGYCTFVSGNLVAWKKKKQNVVARSSAKAKFRSATHGFCKIL
ncbi:uncharacterized mitochondrial protein AtMg00810-like [Vicia villosa]|uniref:uncharacterized mitochondrial protein AtMg00810-like n=1 Tax=Vicia villosa TaxID=3911 RepID=UPI00273C22E7|nr:uncharacterized mitochondrial protein AtMg00810-like [Vicia villosa]